MAIFRKVRASPSGTSSFGPPIPRCGSPGFGLAARASTSIRAPASIPETGSRPQVSSRRAKASSGLRRSSSPSQRPTLEIRNAETPPIPQMGPPPEVIFSDPAEGELDVPLKAAIRLQFSRDMNPDSFKGQPALELHDCRRGQRRPHNPARAGTQSSIQVRPRSSRTRDSTRSRRVGSVPRRGR